jgi:aldehyde dehydrogenase (NAD+)
MTAQIIGRPALPPFLSTGELKHFIGGQWEPSASGDSIQTYNPANGQVLATLARGGEDDVNRAVAVARATFEGPWSRTNPQDRHALLMRVRDVIDKNWEELALLETLDMGAPLARTRSLKGYVLQVISFFATQTQRCLGQTIPNSLPGNFTTLTLKAPLGVIGGIIPWNGPLPSQWWTVAATIASGCTAVIKPAEDASISVLRTAELLLEAGVPAGVINVVTGKGAVAGNALASHPDVDRICFTGSTMTGQEIIRASAVNMKRLQLELGGKSPDIVFADADLDKAVAGAAMAIFNNSGQICYAGSRLFVQRSIQEEFVARLADFSKTLRVGDPLDPASQLGPLISQRQLDQVLGYVEAGSREGANLVAGGGRLGGDLAGGYYLQPTVFDNVSNDMTIGREEIFGPVVSVIPFDTTEEALRLANDTVYGLAGAVWTNSVKTVNTMMHGIKSGAVWVNCYGLVDPAVGFGGYKQSGYGWKGGEQHIEGFLYQKSVCINGD